MVGDPIIVPAVNYPEIKPNKNIRKNEDIQPVRNYPQNVSTNEDDCDDCCQALLCICLCLRCLAIIAGGR